MSESLEIAAEEREGEARAEAVLLANSREGLEARFLGDRLARGLAATILHVARDQPRLNQLVQLVRFMAPQIEILSFPAWDCLPYDRVSPNGQIMAERLRTLSLLSGDQGKRPRLVLTTVNAVIQRLPAPEVIRAGHFRTRAGGPIDRDAFLSYLERNGYRRSSTVVEPGDYAVRGGIIDVYPTDGGNPVRLDLFGATVETIRTFDALTQRSLSRIEALELRPVSEVMLDAEAIERFKARYLQQFGAVTSDPLFDAISSGRSFPGMEHWLPLFNERLATLFDYMDEECELSFDHLARDGVDARAALIGEHFEARRQPVATGSTFGTTPYRPLPPHMLYLDEQSFGREADARSSWHFSIFAAPPGKVPGFTRSEDLKGRPARDFAPERQDRSVNLFDAASAYLGAMRAGPVKPILACWSEGSADRMRQTLQDHGTSTFTSVKTMRDVDGAAGVALAVLPLDHGVTAPGLSILTEQDILGERLSRPSRRARRADKFIADLSVLSESDLVVHNEHGIGRFEGLETLEIGGAPHDCLRLVYAGGDKLYLPVENLEVLSRFGQSDGDTQLDKLGGVGWQNRKAKVKERIKELAQDLIKVAAERAMRKGTVLDLPPGIYDEFCARFPYEETDDQLRAIEAVMEDMASGHPMDRLICGDVGFGKTEVAIRAAFTAAMSGKQVALLAPTTLLVRQHHNVFTQRFAGLPVRVAQLSRFVTQREAEKVKKGLAQGEIDIVIGTHALLAKSVTFADLGLVIVDEEQHFGVSHKEKLKRLRAEVHILTMTATPIPRTLHMALGGMKDLSIIATPPIDRLAVRSFVMPADPVVLREAILREYHRGGQTFYVCPRVSDQPRLLKELSELVPEIKIGVANGQLPINELERVMSDFYDRRLDLLLATNIVESGLDIPNANTLIVHRSDLFGLSQLYQLRGRVGRSKVRGYAYFTVSSDKKLADTAEKRLSVIQSLDGLGAGFQLASHDLDIRGAGNLLGDEQSGQIKEVGFELYNHMLEEAVNDLKARTLSGEEARSTDWTPQITIDAAALMPESWIGDLDLRLSMYRRLASLGEPSEIEEFAAELVDRFGPMPYETEQLLQIVAIKQQCKKANIAKLDAGPKGIVVSFFENRFERPERLISWISETRGSAKVRPDHKLVLLGETTSPKERLQAARKLVDGLARLAA